MLAACDLAVVVAEADEKKIPALQLIMRKLDELGVPRILFLNKIDKASAGVRDTLKLLQPASTAPLLLRQIPLRKDGVVIGSIDLALERAYIWREFAESEVAEIPGDDKAREIEARFSMLETLADHDDQLMEQLLDEIEPPKDAVFDDLAADLRAGVGDAGADRHRRKGQRRAAPLEGDPPRCARCRGDPRAPRRAGRQGRRRPGDEDHPHRAWRQAVDRRGSCPAASPTAPSSPCPTAASGKVSGIYRMLGKDQSKLAVRQGRRNGGAGQARRSQDRRHAELGQGRRFAPLAALDAAASRCSPSRCGPKERKDEVKLSAAIQRLAEEDPSLSRAAPPGFERDGAVGPWRDASARHRRAAGGHATRSRSSAMPRPSPIARPSASRSPSAAATRSNPAATASSATSCIDIKPLPRGSGFQFTDTITGGVVPKTYIPSVETGVRDYLKIRSARLSGRRCRGQPRRRLLPLGRFLRHGLPDGGQARHEGGHGGLLAGAAGAGDEGRDLHAVAMRRPRSPRSCRSGAARSSATMPGPAGRDGMSSRRPCRNPRSAT